MSSGVPGLKRTLIALSLILLVEVTISCGSGSGSSSGTTYGGTYSVSDEFGGGSGTVSFILENNYTIFCFTFSGHESSYSTACKNPATDSFPINGNQFSIPITTAQGTYTLEGQFTSSVQAAGDLLAPPGSHDALPVLNWTATGEGDDD